MLVLLLELLRFDKDLRGNSFKLHILYIYMRHATKRLIIKPQFLDVKLEREKQVFIYVGLFSIQQPFSVLSTTRKLPAPLSSFPSHSLRGRPRGL